MQREISRAQPAKLLYSAKLVNGDRSAQLTVQKNGANGILLTVTDRDPKTGKNVVTSRIDLKRT